MSCFPFFTVLLFTVVCGAIWTTTPESSPCNGNEGTVRVGITTSTPVIFSWNGSDTDHFASISICPGFYTTSNCVKTVSFPNTLPDQASYEYDWFSGFSSSYGQATVVWEWELGEVQCTNVYYIDLPSTAQWVVDSGYTTYGGYFQLEAGSFIPDTQTIQCNSGYYPAQSDSSNSVPDQGCQKQLWGSTGSLVGPVIGIPVGWFFITMIMARMYGCGAWTCVPHRSWGKFYFQGGITLLVIFTILIVGTSASLLVASGIGYFGGSSSCTSTSFTLGSDQSLNSWRCPGDVQLMIAGLAIEAAGGLVIFVLRMMVAWGTVERGRNRCKFCKEVNWGRERCQKCWSPITPTLECGFCKKTVPEKDKNCDHCGNYLFKPCQRCNTNVRVGAGSCRECKDRNWDGGNTSASPANARGSSVGETSTRYTGLPMQDLSSASTGSKSRGSTLNDSAFLKGITVDEQIGKGNFGVVYKGRWYQTEVALKHVPSLNEKEFAQEALTLQKLQHPNIVTFYGIFTDPASDRHFMVTEYCNLLDLKSFLIDNSKLPLRMLLNMAKQGAAGMAYLSDNKIVHRDLAARNLLVCSAGGPDTMKYTIKVGDFGLARPMEDKTLQADSAFAVKWAAVEVLKYGKWYPQSDIWAFGIVLYEIVTRGTVPYPEFTENAQVVREVLGGYRLKQPRDCPADVYALMQQCWQEDPVSRPSFAYIGSELAAMEANCKDNAKKTSPSEVNESSPKRDNEHNYTSQARVLSSRYNPN